MLNYAHDQAEGLRQLMFQQKNRTMSVETAASESNSQTPTEPNNLPHNSRPEVQVWAVFKPEGTATRHPDDLSESPIPCVWDNTRQSLRINQKILEQWYDDYAEAQTTTAPQVQDIRHLIDLGNQAAESFLLQFEPGVDDLTHAYSLIKLFHQRLGLTTFHVRLMTNNPAQANQVYKNLEKAATRYLGVRLYNQPNTASANESSPGKDRSSTTQAQPQTSNQKSHRLNHRGLIMAAG